LRGCRSIDGAFGVRSRSPSRPRSLPARCASWPAGGARCRLDGAGGADRERPLPLRPSSLGPVATLIDIRLAELRDLPRIFAIYNREVVGGLATFDIETREPGRDDGWLIDRAPYHPVTAAVDATGDVAGWAAIGPWSPRGAYRRTGEVSVYVEPGRRGGGIGTALLADLVERARSLPEIHVLLARIAQPNPVSVAAHEAAGFRSFGIQRRCGEKLGRVLDVELFDLHLD
jgi:phosphinothricin acetyltransferase